MEFRPAARGFNPGKNHFVFFGWTTNKKDDLWQDPHLARIHSGDRHGETDHPIGEGYLGASRLGFS